MNRETLGSNDDSLRSSGTEGAMVNTDYLSTAAPDDTTASEMCRPGRKDARGQTKRLPQRGGQNAVRPDTLIPRPRLSNRGEIDNR